MTRPEFSPAVAGDRPAIESLLVAADLPHQDFAAHLEHFRVAREAGRLVGAVGLEVHGKTGLLRSLVVDPSQRGRGLGLALTEDILAYARELDLQQVYLLTTTAADFFPKFGFTRCQRDDAPEEIRATEEFASLCPSTAVCMVKTPV